MGLKIKMDHPDFPKGTPLAVSGLGEFENGEAERDVTEEQEQAFVNERGMSVRDALKDHPHLSVSGSATAKVPDTTETEVEEEEGDS
jgi:hypothetical protein